MKDKLQERQESADTESKSQKVAKGIHTAINNVDESLHYEDFAKAVAITLKENYGTHNIAPFMKVLHAGLGINEVKAEDLEEDQSYASSFGTSSKKIDKEEVEVALNKRGYDTPKTGIWNKILVKKDGARIGMIDTEESTYTRDGKKYEWEGTQDFIKQTKPLNEAKATCCHRCGRVHVKGTPCKKPYLKGKKSCAIKEVQDLQEMYKKIKETKSAPKGHYFTKAGNLVKGRMTKDAEERGARKSDPKDKMRSKVPKPTQYTEIVKEYVNNNPKMKKSEMMEAVKNIIKINN